MEKRDLTLTPAHVAKIAKSGWDAAGRDGAHITPELRRAMEESGVPANQVVDRVNDLVDRRSGRVPARGAKIQIVP